MQIRSFLVLIGVAYKQRLKDTLLTVVPMYGLRSKQGSRKIENWVAPKRSKPRFYVFNATNSCMCLSGGEIVEKRVDIWHWKRSWPLIAKSHPRNHYFVIRCLRLGSHADHETYIWVGLKKVREPLQRMLCTSMNCKKQNSRASNSWWHLLPDSINKAIFCNNTSV